MDDPERLLATLRARVLAALAEASPATTRSLGARVEGFDTTITMGSGKWAQEGPVGPWLLFLLAMELEVVRGASAGSWRSSQYAWARAW